MNLCISHYLSLHEIYMPLDEMIDPFHYKNELFFTHDNQVKLLENVHKKNHKPRDV